MARHRHPSRGQGPILVVVLMVAVAALWGAVHTQVTEAAVSHVEPPTLAAPATGSPQLVEVPSLDRGPHVAPTAQVAPAKSEVKPTKKTVKPVKHVKKASKSKKAHKAKVKKHSKKHGAKHRQRCG